MRNLFEADFGAWGEVVDWGVGGDRVFDLGWRLTHGLLSAGLQPSAVVVLCAAPPPAASARRIRLLRQLGASPFATGSTSAQLPLLCLCWVRRAESSTAEAAARANGRSVVRRSIGTNDLKDAEKPAAAIAAEVRRPSIHSHACSRDMRSLAAHAAPAAIYRCAATVRELAADSSHLRHECR